MSEETDRLEIDILTEFAAWLTTRETVIKAGASVEVYDMIEALREFKQMKADEAAS
jgi:hypothetical protein